MKLFKKSVDLVVKGSDVQKVNDVLSDRGLKEIKSRSGLSYIKNKKRSLTPVEQAAVDALGWQGAGELGINRKMIDDRDAEIKHLKGRIVDLSPGIFKMSVMTRVFATINFVVLLVIIVLGINLNKYLDLQLQKHYSNEIIKIEQEKNEALLRSERTINEILNKVLDEEKAKVQDLDKQLNDAQKEVNALKKKLDKVK